MAIAAKRAVSDFKAEVAAPSDPAPVRALSLELPNEGGASPARALQADLEQRLSDVAPSWSRRRTALVALGVSGVLWVGVVAVVAGVISAL